MYEERRQVVDDINKYVMEIFRWYRLSDSNVMSLL